MAKSRSTLFVSAAAIILLALSIAFMAGIFEAKLAPGIIPSSSQSSDKALPVLSEMMAIVESVPASVEAKQATLISSRVMARITQISVRAGDTVEAGQILLMLEKSDLEARLQQSRELKQVISARLTEAKQNLMRIRQLHAQGMVASADLDKARAASDALAAQLAAAQQALLEAQTTLAYTEIRSPIDGRVIDRFAEPGDTATPGVKLLSIFNPVSLRVEAPVREHLALSLRVGQVLSVEIPSISKITQATVEELVPVADPGTRSFRIKARVPFAPDLLPGMYARLQVPAGTEKQLLVPADRVAHIGQLDVVWVLEDGVASRRFVQTGPMVNGDRVQIISGLAADDLILPAP